MSIEYHSYGVLLKTLLIDIDRTYMYVLQPLMTELGSMLLGIVDNRRQDDDQTSQVFEKEMEFRIRHPNHVGSIVAFWVKQH